MRRVQRDQRNERIVDALAKGEPAIFKDIWRLLLFCSSLGRKYSRREPLEKIDSGKSMPQTYFDGATAWPGFQHLLTIVESQDPGALAGNETADDHRITIFEEYANGGFSILAEKLESSSYSLDSLVMFIVSETAGTTASSDLDPHAITF